jgi:hypothetical protein
MRWLAAGALAIDGLGVEVPIILERNSCAAEKLKLSWSSSLALVWVRWWRPAFVH